MIETYDLFQLARDGAKAAADNDSGRSLHLIDQVAEAMKELTLSECEWLSIAVSNGAYSRQLHATPTPIDVEMRTTEEGEVWDI